MAQIISLMVILIQILNAKITTHIEPDRMDVYRFYRQITDNKDTKLRDNYYSTSLAQPTDYDLVVGGAVFSIFDEESSFGTDLYRVQFDYGVNGVHVIDTYLTIDITDAPDGYDKNKEIIGKCFANQNEYPGLVPLYELWGATPSDHFYTIDLTDEAPNYVQTEKSIVCYVKPGVNVINSYRNFIFRGNGYCVSGNDVLYYGPTFDQCLNLCAQYVDGDAKCLSIVYFPTFLTDALQRSVCALMTDCSGFAQWSSANVATYGQLYLWGRSSEQNTDCSAGDYFYWGENYCFNKNADKIWDISLTECKTACDELVGCISIEYFPNHPARDGTGGHGHTVCHPSTDCSETEAIGNVWQDVNRAWYGDVWFFSKCLDFWGN